MSLNNLNFKYRLIIDEGNGVERETSTNDPLILIKILKSEKK